MRCYGEYILFFASSGIILKKRYGFLLDNYIILLLGVLECKTATVLTVKAYLFEILFCQMHLEITILIELHMRNKKEGWVLKIPARSLKSAILRPLVQFVEPLFSAISFEANSK